MPKKINDPNGVLTTLVMDPAQLAVIERHCDERRKPDHQLHL